MFQIAENMVVNCDTEEKAIIFLEECEKQGCKWLSGTKPLTRYNHWHVYKENTCYLISHCKPRKRYFLISYERIDYFKENGYSITNFNHLKIEDDKTAEQISLI